MVLHCLWGYAQTIAGKRSAIKTLAGECKGDRGRGGEEVLGRISNGDTPRWGMAWPLEPGQRAEAQPLEVLWPDRRRKQRAKRRHTVTEPDAVDSDMGQVQSGMDIIANGNDGDDKDVEEVLDDEDPWAEGTWYSARIASG